MLKEAYEITLVDLIQSTLISSKKANPDSFNPDIFKQVIEGLLRAKVIYLINVLFIFEDSTLQDSQLFTINVQETELANASQIASSKYGDKLKEGKSENVLKFLTNTQSKDSFAIFQRYLNRYQIMSLYNQEKYNLLREENQGFSKFLVLLSQPNRTYFQEKCSDQEIDKFTDKMRKLVEFYSLDPTRCTDLVLEAFEVHISLLRKNFNSSPYILTGKEIIGLTKLLIQLINNLNPIKQTSSKNISALLGFKLHNFQYKLYKWIAVSASPGGIPIDQQDPEQVKLIVETLLPQDLFILVALLIRENIIEAEHLLPYLQQPIGEEDIQNKIPSPGDLIEYTFLIRQVLNQKYQGLELKILDANLKKKEQEDQQAQMKRAEDIFTKKLPYDFHWALLAAHFQVNDFDSAEIMIDYINALENSALTKSKFKSRNISQNQIKLRERESLFDSGLHKEVLQTLFSYLENLLTPFEHEMNQSQRIKTMPHTKRVVEPEGFIPPYWEKEASAGIRVISNSLEKEATNVLVTGLQRLLPLLDVNLGLNTVIFSKLMRVTHYMFIQLRDSQTNWRVTQYKNFAFQMAGEYFLPALCASSSASIKLDEELWDILKKAPFQERYQFYLKLIGSGYICNLKLLRVLVDIHPKAIKFTKTLSDSKEQSASMKEQVMRIGNGGNTLILAAQIMRVCANYNNWIKPLLQTLSYLRDLAHDMIAFTIVRHLNEKQEEYQTVDSEANPPLQLSYVIEFASNFFIQYSQTDIKPLIVYILSRITNGNHTYETFIMSSILTSLTGWKNLEIQLLNDKQLQGLAGGVRIKVDLMEQILDFKKAKQKRGPELLKKVFFQEFGMNQVKDQQTQLSLAFRLMAHIAQQVEHVKDFEDFHKDLSPIQNMFDKTQSLFRQLVDSLFYLNEDRNEYSKLLPSTTDLTTTKILSEEYRIPYHYSIYILRKALPPLSKMTPDEVSKNSQIYSQLLDIQFQNKLNEYVSKDDWDGDNQMDAYEEKVYFNETQFINEIQLKDFWQSWSPELFFIFWHLDLSDINVPQSVYQEQIKLKEENLNKMKEELKLYQEKSSKLYNTQKEIETLETWIKELKDELAEQQLRQKATQEFLSLHLQKFFAKINKPEKVIDFFVQYCLYPRLMMSPCDAIFGLKFVKILIDLKVPNFNILDLNSQILNGILSTLNCCTVNEIENLGLFFMEWFLMLDRWTKPQIWKEECSQFEGFSKTNSENQSLIITQDFYVKEIFEPTHKNFSNFLQGCLQNPSEEFTKIKCVLKILYRLRQVFPKTISSAKTILNKVDEIVQMKGSINKDISTVAQRYQKVLTDIITSLKTVKNEKISKLNEPERTSKRIISNDDQKREGQRIRNSDQVDIAQDKDIRKRDYKNDEKQPTKKENTNQNEYIKKFDDKNKEISTDQYKNDSLKVNQPTTRRQIEQKKEIPIIKREQIFSERQVKNDQAINQKDQNSAFHDHQIPIRDQPVKNRDQPIDKLEISKRIFLDQKHSIVKKTTLTESARQDRHEKPQISQEKKILDEGVLTVIKFDPKSREKITNTYVRTRPSDIRSKYDDKRDKRSDYKTLTIGKDYEDQKQEAKPLKGQKRNFEESTDVLKKRDFEVFSRQNDIDEEQRKNEEMLRKRREKFGIVDQPPAETPFNKYTFKR